MADHAATAHAPRDLEIIDGLMQGAFELAKMVVERAKACPDNKVFCALMAEYRGLSYAVRMAIRLKTKRPRAVAQPSDAAREPPEPPGRAERPERLEREYERERSEPTSLPLFLKAMRAAAARAERHAEDYPAHIREQTLPRLKGLLAQAGPPPAPKRRTAATVPERWPPYAPDGPAELEFDAAPPVRGPDSS